MNTSDVNIEIDNLLQIKNDYGYLAVFNDLILRPVCWGKIENKKIFVHLIKGMYDED